VCGSNCNHPRSPAVPVEIAPVEIAPVVQCTNCMGECDFVDMLTDYQGMDICTHCGDTAYFYCPNNEELYPNSDAVEYTPDDGRDTVTVSRQWAEENADYCEACSASYETTHSVTNSRGREIEICQHCRDDGDYYTCDDCSETFHRNVTNSVSNRIVCEGCYENYSYCDGCDQSYPSDGECDCRDVASSSGIHDYGYKPRPIFRGTATASTTYIGFELEIEAGKDTRLNDLAAIIDDQYLYKKHDGSLSNGLEIVSHPATLEVHQGEAYKALFEALSKAGARSHDTKTCGLHFHLDKRGMLEGHKIRLGMFFAVCKSELELLARRSESTYAKYKKLDESLHDYKNDERYSALNWQNPHTVEYRIYKGTLKYETFMASLELCHATYSFTKMRNCFSCKFDNDAIFRRFLKYTVKNKNKYPNLVEYLSTKNFNVGA